MNAVEVSERTKYISEQAALALGIARSWFAEVEPTEQAYEEIRVWIMARLAERGITEDEIGLAVVLDRDTRRARFDFKLKTPKEPAKA